MNGSRRTPEAAPGSRTRAAGPWRFQLRIVLADDVARVAREGGAHPDLQALNELLAGHNAVLRCQYDAFADYCAEAERLGVDRYPLYAWTKATIEDPVKKAKYVRSFTLYVNGDEVYDKAKADALEAELQPLIGGPAVADMAKHDTNPANNPQRPKRYRS